MKDIHITSINQEKLQKEASKKRKMKLKRIAATGLIVVAMLPTLAGCGNAKAPKNPDEPTVTVTYFDEETRERDAIFFTQAMTNSAIEELAEFGDHVKSIYLYECFSIDDISRIVEYCPNLETISISYCPSISDLSLIYSLPNLKKVDIKESGYVTPELVEYLDRNGIEHNITQEDLGDTAELDRIISEIITDDMTDEEKIQAVTYYVIDNYKYKITKVEESNLQPLSSTLKNKGGVCASYAYLTNILLRKAGIKSYEVVTTDAILGHGWNMVELDGKYYYIDTTNIKQFPGLSKMILKHFNVGLFYMTDPRANGMSTMKDFDKAEKVSIPQEMIEDIERGESEKNIIEKYGNSVPARIIEVVMAITAVTLGVKLTTMGIDAVSDTVSRKKYRKAEEARRKREAARRASRTHTSYY